VAVAALTWNADQPRFIEMCLLFALTQGLLTALVIFLALALMRYAFAFYRWTDQVDWHRNLYPACKSACESQSSDPSGSHVELCDHICTRKI